MTRQTDSDPLFENESPSMLSRILPPLVLICAFGGFVSLAVYAYRAGTQSVPEGELMVIEADASPMKEKPADPGGMQFPNQDKTIFEAIGNGEQPAKVERVLPTPEEPIAPAATQSAEVVPATPIGAEQVFGDDESVPAVPAAPSTPHVKNIQEELGKQAVSEIQPVPVETVAKPVDLMPKQAAPAVAEKPKTVVKEPEIITKVKEKTPVKVPEKTTPKTAVVAEKSAKGLVQLGAYKSEPEAKADFARLQKKYPALAGKSPTINRADLGEKGIFFRLRVATDDAKKLCASLAGQACMAVK